MLIPSEVLAINNEVSMAVIVITILMLWFMVQGSQSNQRMLNRTDHQVRYTYREVWLCQANHESMFPPQYILRLSTFVNSSRNGLIKINILSYFICTTTFLWLGPRNVQCYGCLTFDTHLTHKSYPLRQLYYLSLTGLICRHSGQGDN